MISGDHFETAKAQAIKSGILNEEDLSKQNCVMEAEDFRNITGILQPVQVQE